jgi:hypothetical protein
MRPENENNTFESQDVTLEGQGEKSQNEKKNKVATLGIAAALGTAFGVAGTAVASPLIHPKETSTQENNNGEISKTTEPTPEVHHHHHHPAKTIVVPVEEQQQEPEIKVTSYEITTDDSGNRYEIANITIDGHLGQILDGNSDGYADVAWIDYNDDGTMQQVELTGLQEEGTIIRMNTLREQADVVVNKYDILADNDVLLDTDSTDGLIEPDNDDQLVEERTNLHLPDYTEEDNLIADNNSNFEDLGPDYSNDADISGFIG